MKKWYIVTWEGHAWVVDGFIRRERMVKIYDERTLKLSFSSMQSETLFHCNWGWGGTCDGYYASGIFNTDEDPKEWDEKDIHSDSKSNGNFKDFICIITYNL